MKTKKDFWKTVLIAYLLIFLGIIILLITDENNPFEIYFLLGVIVVEVLGLIVIGRALRMSDSLRAVTIWVNTYRAVSFMSPFGGYKRSGRGRESGQESIKEFLQTKSVWIAEQTSVSNPFIIR